MSDHFRFDSIDFTTGNSLNPSYAFTLDKFKSLFNGFIIQNNLTVDVEVRGESGTSASYIVIPAGSNKKVVVSDKLKNEVLWFSGGADGESLQVEWAANIEDVEIGPSSGGSSGGQTDSKPGQYNIPPKSLSDEDIDYLAIDEAARLILASYNDSTGSDQSEVINPVEYTNFGPVTMLDAVTADGASTPQEPSNQNKHVFYIQTSGITTGGRIYIESNPDKEDASGWAKEHDTGMITENGAFQPISFSNEKRPYWRVSLADRIDGTFTVIIFSGI